MSQEPIESLPQSALHTPAAVNMSAAIGETSVLSPTTPLAANGSSSRPPLGTRKSSGTIIIPRDSPYVEVVDEEYDANDARAMSPRRSSDEIERLGDDARQALEEQARALQANLLEIVDRVESVKSEHEKLEGGNKFLQSYIGELMQTSKITSSGGKQRGRHRERK